MFELRRHPILKLLKQLWLHIKPYSQWIIWGITLFFLLQTLINHWHEVTAIQITTSGWATLVIALGVTLLAHTWSGWVWTWILKELNQQVNVSQFVQVYLRTNLAKYLPGNVWHYYGRITAAKKAGISTSVAALSVVLEPLLMAAAALSVALLGISSVASNTRIALLSLLGLCGVLCVVHPRFLNTVMRAVGKSKFKKNKANQVDTSNFGLTRYPLRPLLGELGFILLRGIGFLLTILALQPLLLSQLSLLLGTFSLAWLLGLIVPGAPGGLGVFEATAIALLQNRLAAGVVISAIALYRLVSILAETMAAGLAWLDEHR